MLTRRSLFAATLAIPCGIATQAAADDAPVRVPYTPTGREPRARIWHPGVVMNQHRSDACQSYAAVATWMAATRTRITQGEAHKIAHDLYSSDNLHGTSASAQHVMERMDHLGLVESWTWPQTVDDVVDAVSWRGPVSLFVRADSRFTDAYGRPRIAAGSGGLWEGHEVCAVAYHPNENGRGPSLLIRNSWGKSWGINGSAWLRVKDLRTTWPQEYPGHVGEYAISGNWLPLD